MFNAARQHYLLYVVSFFMTFQHVGCSQKNRSKPSNDSSSNPLKNGLLIEGSENPENIVFELKQEGACESFHNLLIDTLNEHLFRVPQQKNELFLYAYSYMKTFPNETSISFSNWSDLIQNQNLIELPASDLAQCNLIEQLSNSVTFDLDLSKSPDAKLIETYLIFYRYFLTLLDGGLSGLQYKSSISKRLRSFGLVLNSRPDYFYPINIYSEEASKRNPNYLYIRSIHPQSVLHPYRQQLIGKYIVSLCVTHDTCYDIDQQSFSSTAQNILTHQNQYISIKLFDPVNQSYQNYSLLVEDLEPTLANSYVYPSPDEGKPIFVINVKSFRSNQLSKNLDYIFDTETTRYQRQYGSYPQNIVIDLRDNPGGLIDQAEALAEYFFPEKTLLYSEFQMISESQAVKNKDNENAVIIEDNGKYLNYAAKFTQRDNRPPQFKETPPKIIVLLNKRSASASEIFAALMKDHQSALIIGEPSFGKGIGQTSIEKTFADIPIKRYITQAYFFSPLGVSHFLKPDLVHKEHFNPYDNSQAITISDVLGIYNFDQPGQAIGQNPGNLNLGYPLKTQALISNDAIESFYIESPPQGCRVSSDPSQIKEERDCLLDLANLYFSQWSKLNSL